MRAARALMGQKVRRGAGGSSGGGGTAWVATRTYAVNDIVTDPVNQQSWKAVAPVPRGMMPQGVGDGSAADRQLLLAQLGPVAKAAGITGGLAGPTYVVTDPNDTEVSAGVPAPGTLRYGLHGTGLTNPHDPLWIVFSPLLAGMDVEILKRPNVAANKTIDGRAAPGMRLVPRLGIQCVGADTVGNPTTGTSTARYPNGEANHIWAYLSIALNMSTNNQQGFAYSLGSDRFTLLHVAIEGGTDTTFSVVRGAHGGGSNVWGPNGKQVRAELTWIKFGPVSNLYNLAKYPPTGGDNRPENAKVSKVGLDPEDQPYMDQVEVLFNKCWWDSSGQRQPTMDWSRVRMVNCHVSRWGHMPGVAKSTLTAAYQARGFNPVVPGYGTAATQIENGAMLISRNCIYTPYNAEQPNGVDPSWPMIEPDKVAIKLVSTGQRGLDASGLYLRNGATVANNFGSVWTPSVAVEALAADDALVTDLELGAGNYQPWVKI